MNCDKTLSERSFTRGQFLTAAKRAAAALHTHGIAAGDTILHYFGQNDWIDLAFRMATTFTSTVPVTCNWQADTAERIVYKATSTACRAVVFDQLADPEVIEKLRTALPDTVSYSTSF